MKTNVIAGLGLALGLALAGAASAGTPHYDARQQNQRQRIAQGVGSGELTMRETRRSDGTAVRWFRPTRR